MTSYATLDTYFSSHCDCRRGFWVLWDCCRGGGYRQDPVLYFYRALFGLVYIRQEKYLADAAGYGDPGGEVYNGHRS
jgi:hypothetical protein